MGAGCEGVGSLLLSFFDDKMGESGEDWSIETRLEGGSYWSPALVLLLAIGLSYCGLHSAVGGTFSEALMIIREAFGILSLAILGSNTFAALAPTTTVTATGIPSATPHLGPCVEHCPSE